MTRWTRLTLCFGGALLVGISCRDDNNAGPTDPGTSEGPALATTTTTAPAFAQVSAGLLHTCGVTTDNRAYCWGWNVFGQIGNGSKNFSNTRPLLVAGGLRFRQISAGWYKTCAVTTDNRAYCWGEGILKPAAVPGGLPFLQVSTAESHTCGVTTDNRAYCWGLNTRGQLGNGTTDPSSNSQPTPVAVTGGLRFRNVTVGTRHSCGVTTTDRAYCWGGDGSGEIGDGTSHDSCMFSGGSLPCRKSPTLVSGGYRFRQLDAGDGHNCGVTTDNRALCWGVGSNGQRGYGGRSTAFSPRPVSGGLQFRSVSAGHDRSCGVTTANRAYCWGENSWGGLGDGTTTRRLTPTAVAGGLSFREVSAGGGHTCGTTPGNVGYCWGYNGEGELGDGTTTRRLKPRAVVGPM